MTILETERLVRKLTELLQESGSAELAPKLAGDYAAACHAANLRVQQCEAMIKAGDRPQAIQLAETAPNLLDFVSVLEFHGSDDWRSYCQKNSLPVPDRIDARSVKVLNDAYAQGITLDHPLYAAYRRAMLHRNDEAALKTLQSITRLNPADTNAATELVRLDARVLTARLQHLGASLEAADPALLVAEIEAIEGFGFKNQPDGEIWRQAQVVRCGRLLTEAAKSRDTDRWPEALATLNFIRRLQKEFKLDLPPDLLPRLAPLEAWAQGEQEKDRQEREFQSLLSQLRRQIQASEEKDTSSRYVQLPELRDDYEALHKTWRALTGLTRPLPEALAASFHKRAGLLEAELARRAAIRVRLILGVSAAAVLLAGLLAWLVTAELRSRHFSRELQAAMDQRQVRAADKLLDQAHTAKIGDARVVAAAETFSAGEHARLTDFETALGQLPATLTGEPDAARLSAIADQLARTRDALNALAPDLKTENESRLQTFEQNWQDYLASSGTVVNGLLAGWVAAAEKQADNLDYRSPLDRTAGQLAELSKLVQKMQDCEAGFGKNLQLRTDLLQRSAAVQSKFAAYEGELGKLSTGLAALQKARTTGEFSAGIKTITSSEFSISPPAVAALAIQSLEISDQTVLRTLLNATNPNTWAYIQKPGPPNFIPEVVMPAERRIFQELNDDPAVNAHHQHYRLTLDTAGNNKVDWITADVLDDSTGWKQVKAWTLSPTATSADFASRDYGYFGGQFKLSPTEPVYQLDLIGPRDDTAPFHTVGLEKVLTGAAYARPLLAVLDALKDSRDGSPLFRAYFFLRIIDIMKLQPDAWGLSFCPAAQQHAEQMQAIAGGQLESGDWFVPGKTTACGDRLEQFFKSVRPISYAQQAEGILRLDRAALKSGLSYVGFAGLDGRLHFVEGAGSAEAWGYGASHRPPGLMMVSASGRPVKEPALPLSPLFSLGTPDAEFLNQAGVDPQAASFHDSLPPLFQEPLQP